MIAPNSLHAASPAVAGLFAGIGGIELGLHRAGFRSTLLCEIDEAANRVLAARFPGVRRVTDVRSIDRLPPRTDLVTAGFPCQDLSQAGKTAGIRGARSGLVGEVFRLLEKENPGPRWLLLENVRFMLSLEQGRAMTFLTDRLTSLGYRWAYRVVDSRSFGLPQRRQRVLLLASRTDDPRGPLLGQDRGGEERRDRPSGVACGFYWTEGLRGLGWAVDAVPTLKGGSTIGIPSPPAIWTPKGEIVTPDVRDAERLQGFPEDWTRPAVDGLRLRQGVRWKLVGNAVSVPLATWIGRRLLGGPHPYRRDDPVLRWDESWPDAAWNDGKVVHRSPASMYPVRHKPRPLTAFLRHPPRPLSARATEGFLSRARRSSLRFPPGLLDVVERHLARVGAG
jgi:DNA (cytosine-5)-methyltransferase 1